MGRINWRKVLIQAASVELRWRRAGIRGADAICTRNRRRDLAVLGVGSLQALRRFS
jgi:hypothetical protein